MNKKFISALSIGILCAGINTSDAFQAVLEDMNGDFYSVYIDPNTPFKDLVSEIQNTFSVCYNELSEELSGGQAMEIGWRLSLPEYQIGIQQIKKESQAEKSSYRDYYKQLEEPDMKDIHFIVSTLGNITNPLKIASKEKALKTAGGNIDSVHPLIFLTYVFTNEELKVAMHKMEGKFLVWGNFIDGLAASLKQEKEKGNLMPFVSDFARNVQIDSKLITEHLEKGRWKEFVKVLIHNIPRKGETDRYKI